jgi:phosphohistidine phosphatase
VEIYIMRHGDAVDHEDPGVTSDEMRELTGKGRDESELMARMLVRLGVTPGLVLTSPLVRARQTADIVAGITSVRSGPSVSDELAPGGSLTGVLNDILSHGRPRQSVLVGHMPGVGQLVGLFAWQDAWLVKRFRTAEICRIDLPDDGPVPGAGDLRWTIPPRVAQRLIGN